MKEFVEKLIESFLGECVIYAENYEKALNIANELTEEYINTPTDTSSGWIPCSERLPEDGTCVLTCNKSGHIYREIWGGCYTVNHYPATKFGYDSETIIAWQPLPAPYKEGE